MYPSNFAYHRPETIDEAVSLLTRHGDDAKVLAGGHSLIPAMKLRLAQPTVIIDIGRIANLNYVREAADHVAIGAMVTHGDIESSALLKRVCPLLPETATHIGDVQVRNKGTIGGNIAHADPAADWPATVLALDAEIDVVGPSGRRTLRAGAFFIDLLQTALAPDEILSEIRVPKTTASVAYVKTVQKASGFALAGVAVVVSSAGVRVGITGVAAKAYRAEAVERALGRGSVTPESIALASSHAGDGVEALSDIHASAEFRVHLAQVNTVRALMQATSR